MKALQGLFSIFFLLILKTPLFSCAYTEHTQSCSFCFGSALEQIVYSTEHFLVLVDYAPRVKGHLLVVPKRHIVKAHGLTDAEWKELGEVLRTSVEVFSRTLETDQYILVEKNGPAAFQTVPHVHFHLLPIQDSNNLSWADIFDQVPASLTRSDLLKEIQIFRKAFQEAFIGDET